MSTPLRVLHVHSGNLFGGIETMLLTLAHAQQVTAMETRFALCFEGRLTTELRAADAHIDPLGGVRISRPWTVLRARRRLTALLRARDPQVAVFHSAWSQSVFGPTLRTAGIPMVRWQHAPPDEADWLERWARRTQPDLTLCNSQYTGEALARFDPRQRREIFYYPVLRPTPPAAENRAQLRSALGATAHTVVILQVSRMEPWKGQEFLLDALKILRDRQNWIAWQVGGAQRPVERRYLDKLRRLAAQSGIGERVRFLGERTDVAALMAAADIHCQPNAKPEPFGITFVEALYAGLPVVTFDLGGPAEIVDPSCGILVRAHTANALSEALGQLLNDASRRQTLGAGGPPRARALCAPETQLPRLAGLLRSLA